MPREVRFPPLTTICFDSDAGKNSAREIHEYFVPDLRSLKDHDACPNAFDRLVKEREGKPDPS
jgi:hypothetical protein